MSTDIATELEQRVADSINAERSAAGLDELKIEVHLNSAAQSHSEWMAETGEFSHEGEDSSDVAERAEDAEFPLTGGWRTTENIAYSSISGELDAGEVDRMHEGLMDSAGHRANILDPDVSYIGIGLAVGERTVGGVDQEVVYLTENFAETDGEVLVQEEDEDGATVLQPYLDGEPIGEPALVEPASEEDVDEDEEAEEDEESEDVSISCFVATAAFGNPIHPDVVVLRRFRDEVLVRHRAGRAFVRAYWVIGPKLARLVSHDGKSGQAARAVISPLARLSARRLERLR